MYLTKQQIQTSEQAFRQCYEADFPKVHAFFRSRTTDGEMAKDLSHDLFLKLYQNWEKYTTANSPDAYLFTLARNLLVDHYRKSLKAERFTDPVTIDLPESLPDMTTPNKEEMAAIHKAITQLPEQRQAIFRMKKIQGMSSEEVAEQLGLSKRTVENQVYRAVSSLRKQLVGLLSSLF